MSRKKYKFKPRFFVILVILLCLVIGLGGFALFRGLTGGGAEHEDYRYQQYLQGWQIMMASKVYIANDELRYDDQYYNGGYPPDEIGVCTDVVWKGMKGIDVTLKDLMDRDVAKHLNAYKEVISTPDPNIDFRLVPRLEVFLERKTEVLTTDLTNLLAWQPGDIVTFEHSHVAIVSNLQNLWGMPYIIQHGKDPAAEEDRIFASDGMKISGHYRWPVVYM